MRSISVCESPPFLLQNGESSIFFELYSTEIDRALCYYISVKVEKVLEYAKKAPTRRLEPCIWLIIGIRIFHYTRLTVFQRCDTEALAKQADKGGRVGVAHQKGGVGNAFSFA